MQGTRIRSTAVIQQNSAGQFDVQLVDGRKLTCQSQGDAELILNADRRHYEGNTGRKLPRGTLSALERAGEYALNSWLYRSAMEKLADEG